MLGEAAMTMKDADHFQDYINAIKQVGEEAQGKGIFRANNYSIKLSALHPKPIVPNMSA